MNKGITIFIYLSVLILSNACQNQSDKVEPILQKAENLLEQTPDSALVVLNKINDAQKLKKALYYEFYLLQIQAKYKCYKDITTDTLVFAIRDYYDNKNDIEKAALAAYCSGVVLQEQKKNEKALKELLEAEKYLDYSNNLNLKGLWQSAIGKIYYKQLLHENAATHYKLAKGYYHQAENHKNEIGVSNMIGNCLLMLEKTDSAFTYYNEALTLAKKYEYSRLHASILMGIGVANKEIENWGQAEKYFKMTIEFSTDSLIRAKLAANLARLFELQGKKDSAISQLQKAINYLPQEQNNSLAANIYKTWTTIEENDNNYQNALDKYKLYNKHLAQIINDNKTSAILEIEEKYNFQLIENQNKQLLIERQRILLLSLVLLLFLVVIILLYMNRTVRRERKLKEAEQKILQMQEMIQRYNESENSFRNVLIRHFDILKKTALLEKYLREDERKKGKRLLLKFNEVVYGQKNMDWSLLFQTLNNASNGFFKKLKNRFPQLDDSEFRICCLIYADFNNTEIALILNYKVNTVEVKKGTIRKKLEIESRGNIRDLLNE
ncbi:MAG: tetratricopeptide repeat protein [Candidatus Pacebacteria bacterium]|nr:tetratricopeptide repeat protein [Candidatus Paceibacterota bacterium]